MPPLVMIEWQTHQYIPSARHMAIVTLGEATRWLQQGAEIRMHPIDPELLKEFIYVGKIPFNRSKSP